ncbi:hypothetical protein AVEN_40339-1 [Araneus ventricosus]|uniref:Uncharacterized protein n=1 Tax=Araneus ventricosus TaxID=182803 RepID=A0A4Y2F4S2_ARAVE|nr:hypothetical protein AVEN_40339-1 [Araneus ventricosus]
MPHCKKVFLYSRIVGQRNRDTEMHCYTEEPEKLVHLLNIVSGRHEHAEVLEHDVAWSRLTSEGILEVFHTMNPAGQSTNP